MSGQYSPEPGKFKHMHCTCNWFQALYPWEPGYEAREGYLYCCVHYWKEGDRWKRRNLSNGSLSGCNMDILHRVLQQCLVQVYTYQYCIFHIHCCTCTVLAKCEDGQGSVLTHTYIHACMHTHTQSYHTYTYNNYYCTCTSTCCTCLWHASVHD